MKTIVYLALSKEESLQVDPYNQPVIHLQSREVRVISYSLPAHGHGQNAVEAMGKWADDFQRGHDPLAPFIDHVAGEIEKLSGAVGLMGLSRGGLIAGNLAARLPKVAAWVGFAPLTKLSQAKEFEALRHMEKYDLIHQAEPLARTPARFYIGNRDVRVSTRNCFELVEALSNHAFDAGKRSPPFDLIISPSIGMFGHGTSKEAFCAGADWLATQLGVQ